MNINLKRITALLIILFMGYAAGNLFSISNLKSFVVKAKGINYNTNKYKSRTEVHKLLKTNKNDYIFLGNSITENFEWYEYFNDIRFKNRGIGSDVIQGAIHRLKDIENSKKLFSLIGINDIITDSEVDKIASDYREMVDYILKENITDKLYVVSILPVRGPQSKFNSKIVESNKLIKKLCDEKGITFINAHSLFVDKNGNLIEDYSVDGVHLTGKGYESICKILSPFLT